MKTITKTYSTVTEKGNQIDLTVVVKRGYENVTEQVYVDQPVSVTSKKEVKETVITMVTMGKTLVGSFNILSDLLQKKYNFYAVFQSSDGNFGISSTIYNDIMKIINDAKTEAETDENWMEYKRMEAEGLRIEAEYRKNAEYVEKMMTLNGRTY